MYSSMIQDHQTVPTVYDDVAETMRTNFVGFASFTILVWDHIITFSDEVEYIWKGKKGPIIYLFLWNRYFTPLGFIINLYAYLSPSWTIERLVPFLESAAASASAWYPLLYDSIVFGLTVNRTLPLIRKREAGFILRKLLEDGLLYYSVIFAVTFVLTFMIVGAPPGIKNICAQMEQLITVAMMSRITLSLRKAGRHEPLVMDMDHDQILVLSNGSGTELFSYRQEHPQPTDVEAAPRPAASEAPKAPESAKVKPPERLVLHGRAPIQFAVPLTPTPSPGPAGYTEYPFSRTS
ncbi:hypothetical protein HMN09_01062800 [Mycena chlorophos]|uniref:DUF6533 domain-containing protein n=1 Tax=Mycena chlorophos TaxID=658473 RepID=A0A8H6SCS0_MYCCL|nr:hypothetical protein HMN09_01062800 [Mycena chlorophos]